MTWGWVNKWHFFLFWMKCSFNVYLVTYQCLCEIPLSAILLMSWCSPHFTTYLRMSCSLACEEGRRTVPVYVAEFSQCCKAEDDCCMQQNDIERENKIYKTNVFHSSRSCRYKGKTWEKWFSYYLISYWEYCTAKISFHSSSEADPGLMDKD